MYHFQRIKPCKRRRIAWQVLPCYEFSAQVNLDADPKPRQFNIKQ